MVVVETLLIERLSGENAVFTADRHLYGGLVCYERNGLGQKQQRTRPLTFPLIVGLYELWRLFIVRQIFDQHCQCCCCCHTIDDCVSLSKPSKTGWFLSPFCYILSKIIVVAFLNTFLTMVFPECHSI